MTTSKKAIYVNLDPELHKKLKTRAAKDGTSISVLLRTLIALYVTERDNDERTTL